MCFWIFFVVCFAFFFESCPVRLFVPFFKFLI
uniref:Uncharacterized protein n=1 Tax=Anguilla anguilla TaxID=7936 RepID=A0A0E9SVU2_ANGAN